MADQESGSLPLGGGNKNKQPTGGPPAPVAAKQAAPAEAGWFEVVKGGKLPVKGGVTNVPVGKQVNSASYDVKKLRQAGIELKPIEPPAWYQNLQGTAAALLLVLSLAVGVAGCGGGPVAGGMPEGAAMCELNPIASSCTGVESAQSAVFGPPDFTSNKIGRWGYYQCLQPSGVSYSLSGFYWVMGGDVHVWKDTFSGTWKGRYEDTAIGDGNLFTATVSVAPQMQFQAGMDGPYHVIYNTGPYTEGTYLTTYWHPAHMAVVIPAYGTWIYAKGERQDYPNGVQVITVDPASPSIPDGACNGRMQFVVPL